MKEYLISYQQGGIERRAYENISDAKMEAERICKHLNIEVSIWEKILVVEPQEIPIVWREVKKE